MRSVPFGRSLSALLLAAALAPAAARAVNTELPQFEPHRIASVRTEACCVADFNGDGKLDIVAGPNLYLAPEFKPTQIRTVKNLVDEQGKGYAWDFVNEPLDVDGDGLLDVIACDWFQAHATWHRNPGPAGGEWAETVIEKGENHETGWLGDLDGDGKGREFMPVVQTTFWLEPVKGADGGTTFALHRVSDKKMHFGVGVGDLNGDGRNDIIRPEAWYEAPADIRKGSWTEHPISLGAPKGGADHTAQILVFDVNADGKNDIIASSAHKHGIFWYEQTREGDKIAFRQHTIDDTWSQAHSLTLADLDGDGQPELLTGKRFMAHNGSDPDEFGKLGVYYYTLARDGAAPAWTRHTISFDAGIGAGMNIPVADLDGDGDLDVVVTGKWGGPVWFENKLK